MTYDDIEANSLYDYVRLLAFKYYPDYLLPDMYDAELPSLEEIANVQLHEEEEPIVIGYSKGIDILEKIEAGTAGIPFTREDYDNATSVLESLDAIGLDREKFWLALQFVYYWARERNTNCVPVEPSVQDRIRDLINALVDSRTILSIKRPGKRVYALEDEETRKVLVAMLTYGDAQYCRMNNPTYNGRSLLIMEPPKELKLDWWMMDMYNAFKELFTQFCTDKDMPSFSSSRRGLRNKDVLISRLIYLTRLTEDERFLDDADMLKLVKAECKRNPRPMMSSGFFN